MPRPLRTNAIDCYVVPETDPGVLAAPTTAHHVLLMEMPTFSQPSKFTQLSAMRQSNTKIRPMEENPDYGAVNLKPYLSTSGNLGEAGPLHWLLVGVMGDAIVSPGVSIEYRLDVEKLTFSVYFWDGPTLYALAGVGFGKLALNAQSEGAVDLSIEGKLAMEHAGAVFQLGADAANGAVELTLAAGQAAQDYAFVGMEVAVPTATNKPVVTGFNGTDKVTISPALAVPGTVAAGAEVEPSLADPGTDVGARIPHKDSQVWLGEGGATVGEGAGELMDPAAANARYVETLELTLDEPVGTPFAKVIGHANRAIYTYDERTVSGKASLVAVKEMAGLAREIKRLPDRALAIRYGTVPGKRVTLILPHVTAENTTLERGGDTVKVEFDFTANEAPGGGDLERELQIIMD